MFKPYIPSALPSGIIRICVHNTHTTTMNRYDIYMYDKPINYNIGK